MNLFKWCRGRFSVRVDALSLYKQGLAYAEKHDSRGALDAYTSAIELNDAPHDVKSMALYNRALLFAASRDAAKAVADLNAIIAMPLPLRGVKLAARRRLDRMQRRQDANDTGQLDRQPIQ